MTLIDFLEEEEALEKFYENLKRFVDDGLRRENIHYDINEAFGWRASPQGYSFWQRLYRKAIRATDSSKVSLQEIEDYLDGKNKNIYIIYKEVLNEVSIYQVKNKIVFKDNEEFCSLEDFNEFWKIATDGDIIIKAENEKEAKKFLKKLKKELNND